MKRSLDLLRKDLHQVQDILSRGNLWSFSARELEELKTTAFAVSRRIDEFTDSYLSVGLLGGTGVGKSSLMNALAGSEIASASHRRPHTDRVLVYRHGSAVLPAAIIHTRVPWEEHVHRADGIQQIVLCDLPDIDSLVSLHRQHVLDFLENLDLLVWVVTPEKYADERFHAFLKEAPKAGENYLFVMNKVDLFFAGPEMEAGYQMLAQVMRTFQGHLSRGDIVHPTIYAVSAADALQSPGPAVWNQFNSFRHQVFQERDTKEIVAIKTANLDQELDGILAALDERAFNARKLQTILNGFESELSTERADWGTLGRAVLREWVEGSPRDRVRFLLHRGSDLIGMGSILQTILNRFEGWTMAGRECDAVSPPVSRDGMLGRLTDEWARIENRMVHRALQNGLPADLLSSVKEIFDVDARWHHWSRSVRLVMDSGIREASGMSSRAFRRLQRGAYTLLTSLLIMGLAVHGWELIPPEESGWRFGGIWLAGIIGLLFGYEGFAALASYFMLVLFMGLRFAGSRKKMLQRREQKIIETLKSELERAWDAEFDEVLRHLHEHCRDLDREIEEISSLRRRREGD
jgi:GTPase Era involved in 16S rRNA processing